MKKRREEKKKSGYKSSVSNLNRFEEGPGATPGRGQGGRRLFRKNQFAPVGTLGGTRGPTIACERRWTLNGLKKGT